MNRIHPKTALSQTANLLLAAHEQGESFLWGRYEGQLPLCAFTANGLSCRKCFQGPCRINPFGDEPSRGVCGADRDQIVMENLFQATLDGVLETARSLALLNERPSAPELPDISPDLPAEAVERLAARGIFPVKKDHLLAVQNSYFSSKAYLPQTLRDLTRLGLIHYALLKGRQSRLQTLGRQSRMFDPAGVNVLILGQAPPSFLNRILTEAAAKPGGKNINLFQEGSRPISGFLAPADHGSPELALAMNLDALIVAPNASFPALPELAEKIGLPVLLSEANPEKTLEVALQHHQKRSYFTSSPLLPSAPGSDFTAVYEKRAEIRAALQSGELRGILIIVGEPSVKQSFFERSLDLAEEAMRRGLLVLVGGPISAEIELLNQELERRFGANPPPFPPLCAGSFYELAEWVPFLKDLNSGKAFDRLPAVISFPEFYRTSTWALAVTFLSLGFAVQIGAPLPFWGSPALAEILLKEWPRISGGVLLASPSLPDSQTQAREIGDLIDARNAIR
jgi:Prismane/CO dehydrogenase family